MTRNWHMLTFTMKLESMLTIMKKISKLQSSCSNNV